MARCKGDELLAKIGINKLDKTMEVDFAVLTDLDDCIKVNAKNYVGVQNTDTAAYNQYSVPSDMFNCLAVGCRNTGTLQLTGDSAEIMSAKYFLNHDARDIAGGAATFYLWFENAGSYEVSFSVADAADQNMTNSDTYTKDVVVTGAGFYPVVIDLSEVPASVTGTGWTPTEAGAVFSVAIEVAGGTTGTPVTWGVSSFYFYGSTEEFEVNDVVKIACLTEISGDSTIDAVDASCWGGGYDPDSVAIEKTIVGSSVTPNYWKLNPLMMRGDKTEGWYLQSTSKEVAAVTVDGISYGYVQLPDMFVDECAFTTAAIADDCNVTDSQLSRLSSPVPVSLNERQFLVQDGAQGSSVSGRILVHPSHVGRKIVVSYPKTASVEHYVANDENLNFRRTRMTYTVTQTDGVKNIYVFNNVLVTSFPGTINAEETSFSFTISIQRDKDGNFFDQYRVID